MIIEETMTNIIKTNQDKGDTYEKYNVICGDKNFTLKVEKNETTTPASNSSGKKETNTITTDDSSSSNYLSKSLIILLSLLF